MHITRVDSLPACLLAVTSNWAINAFSRSVCLVILSFSLSFLLSRGDDVAPFVDSVGNRYCGGDNDVVVRGPDPFL